MKSARAMAAENTVSVAVKKSLVARDEKNGLSVLWRHAVWRAPPGSKSKTAPGDDRDKNESAFKTACTDFEG